jgi:ribose transport system substrate-binding protein
MLIVLFNSTAEILFDRENSMFKRKFFILISMLLVVSMILAGCASQDTSQTGVSCDEFKAASVEFQSNIFYDEIYRGLSDGVDETNGELLRAVSGGDLKKELEAVENFLSQDIDVLFISATDPVGSVEAIRKANDAGVPVIAVALGPDPEQDVEIVTFLRSNDYKAASEVAEYILEQIGHEGDVVLADGPQVDVVLQRMKAYKDVIAKYPDVNIAGEAMDEEVTIPANATMIENLLTGAPETKAIFDYAGYGIPAAATVLPNLGMEHVYVGEIDGIPEEIELLASGAVLGATAQQQPYLFGKQAVEAWLTYCADPEGADLPEVIEVPTQLITNENAEEFMEN